LLIPKTGSKAENRKVLKDLLSWILKSGESEVSKLSYAPLPQDLVEKELKTVYALQ
jgi:phosphate transport system substrate-binding protein